MLHCFYGIQYILYTYKRNAVLFFCAFVTKLLKLLYKFQNINFNMIHLSLMRNPKVRVVKKNSLRPHEEATSRGTRLKREPSLIWVTLDSAFLFLL